MVKFKRRQQKQSLMYEHKNLGTIFHELTNLKFREDFLLARVRLMKISSLDINVYNSRSPGRYILPGF